MYLTYQGKLINESVWYAKIKYNDGHTDEFLVKNTSGVKTRTGYMNGSLFTRKDAHYTAFAQAGFNVKSVEIEIVRIEYRPKDGSVRVLR